jgi:hypothetical protein
MKKLSAAILALGLITILGVTLQGQTAVAGPETMTLKGDIIDNKCAAANKDNLSEFVKTHTKQCALMPACAASGYSIYSDGKLYKFDQASATRAHEFLKKENNKLQVVVAVTKAGEEYTLVSIENQM